MQSFKKDLQKSSKAWTYFDLLPADSEGKAYTKCKISDCAVKLAYNQNTSCMLYHIESKHPIQYEEMKNTKNINNQPISRQDTLKFKNISAERASLITKAIADFISQDMRPISIIESSGFRGLIELLEPGYILPTRRTLSEQTILKQYEGLKLKLLKELETVDGCSITFDY